MTPDSKRERVTSHRRNYVTSDPNEELEHLGLGCAGLGEWDVRKLRNEQRRRIKEGKEAGASPLCAGQSQTQNRFPTMSEGTNGPATPLTHMREDSLRHLENFLPLLLVSVKNSSPCPFLSAHPPCLRQNVRNAEAKSVKARKQ